MDEQIRYGPTLIESLWRYRFIVVGATLAMMALGYLVGTQQPQAFESSARVFLAQPNASLGSQVFGAFTQVTEYVPRQAARMSSRSVLQGAIEAEGNRLALDDLVENTTVEGSVPELSLTVTVTDSTAQGAADLANAIANAYREERRANEEDRAEGAVAFLTVEAVDLSEQIIEQQARLEADPNNLALQSAVNALNEQLLEVQGRIQETRLQIRLTGDGVEAFEPGLVPDFPSAPRPRQTLLLFGFFGFIGIALWSYWYAGKSQRVETRNDPEAVLGVPPLGEIPEYKKTYDDPLTGLLRVDPAAAEAYEFVLSSIEFALQDIPGASSILVTSALPGDGKTTTTLQLAIAASRDRRKVVLVDADIRARGLTTVLSADDRTGLSDLAALELEPADVLRRYRFSEQAQLQVVTAGQRRGDPASLLRTSAFRRAMAKLQESSQTLIVDGSPLLAVADATIVAGSVDAMVIVVSRGTPVSELEKVRERLKFVSTPVLGYIYNRSDSSTAGAYGYGYGLAEDDDGERRLLPNTRRKRNSAE